MVGCCRLDFNPSLAINRFIYLVFTTIDRAERMQAGRAQYGFARLSVSLATSR